MHIDTHNHFAVPEYIDLLLNRRTFPYMERSGDDIIFHVSDMDHLYTARRHVSA